MSFTYRPTKVTDLKSCFRILSDRHVYDPVADRDALVAFWKYLLESKAAISRVVEDRMLPVGKQILGFLLCVFVTDPLQDEIKVAFGPHLGRQIHVRWQGGRRAFLNRREIALRNTEGGLNLVVLAQGTAPVSRVEVALRVQARLFEAFVECHQGYVVKELTEEIFGSDPRASALALGWKIVRDFPGEHPDHNGRVAAGSALMGLHRDHCRFPNPLWGLFHPPERLFRFSDPEKDVLEAALHSGTDEEISKALDISIWTIKKRWQRVYEKVDRVIPDLLHPSNDSEPSAVDSRGGQRRRHLLEYLRQLPHEIRPTLETSRVRSAGWR